MIAGYKVGGYDSDTPTVYEFMGCFWLGHPKDYREETINSVNKQSTGDLYLKTRRKTEHLRELGYTVIEMWECEFLKTP